uniref:Uncharacterized protein n=1 Tax=Heterorhabditis bacteriophora TaxID=37862 RepID=A0A1I7X7G4_HETBA
MPDKQLAAKVTNFHRIYYYITF